MVENSLELIDEWMRDERKKSLPSFSYSEYNQHIQSDQSFSSSSSLFIF